MNSVLRDGTGSGLLEEFEAVAERVESMEATSAFDGSGVPLDLIAGGDDAIGQGFEAIPGEAGMCLAGRSEIGINTEMELDVIEGEPRAAPCLQRRWSVDLCEANYLNIEGPGNVLTPGRNGNLDMVDSLQRIPLITVTTLPISSTPSVKTIGS